MVQETSALKSLGSNLNWGKIVCGMFSGNFHFYLKNACTTKVLSLLL